MIAALADDLRTPTTFFLEVFVIGLVVLPGIPSGEVYAGMVQATVPDPQTVGGSSSSEPERSFEGNRGRDAQGDASLTLQRSGPKTLLGSILRSKETQEAEEEGRLDPDRPHLPEASTTVGKNRVVLESGYTFNGKGSSLHSHSYPEAVLRVGMFADWFEFRLGQNFIDEEQKVSGARRRENGAQDLYVGVKVALIEQIQYLPAIALIPQMTIPTGSADVTAGRVLLGLNVDCSWQVIKDLFNLELLIATNDVRDDVHRSHVEVATGLTAAANVRRDLEAFVEWDAFYPAGHSTSAPRARDYAVGGFVYFLTKDFAIDIRAGVGLNAQANDFLAGTGFAIRY